MIMCSGILNIYSWLFFSAKFNQKAHHTGFDIDMWINCILLYLCTSTYLSGLRIILPLQINLQSNIRGQIFSFVQLSQVFDSQTLVHTVCAWVMVLPSLWSRAIHLWLFMDWCQLTDSTSQEQSCSIWKQVSRGAGLECVRCRGYGKRLRKKKSLYQLNLLKKLKVFTCVNLEQVFKACSAGSRILVGKPLTLPLCLHMEGEESEMWHLTGRFPTHQLWRKRFEVSDFRTITTQTDPVCQLHKITSGCTLRLCTLKTNEWDQSKIAVQQQQNAAGWHNN